MRGRFVVLDGVDGCGKSTQAARLVETLRAEGRTVHHLREPGSTELGERLRELLLEEGRDMSPAVETLLFAAARRQTLDEIVAPALARGEWAVVERFHGSTFAYQAVAGELPEESVLELLTGWAGRPAPDLELLLELPVALAAERRGAPTDRIEDKGIAFQEKVAAGYQRYAARCVSARRVSGEGTADEVAARILAEVRRVD